MHIVLFTVATDVCEGTSHKIYKTLWQGDPRVNIQRGKDGSAKAYQVRQVLAARTPRPSRGRTACGRTGR
jgi:hypothetical protein